MTIAIGVLCKDGVVFGADTEESVGSMRRRVHKVPQLLEQQRAMITGTCQNGNLMDTAVERIFDALKAHDLRDASAIGDLLQQTMLGLYDREFKVYPDQTSTAMQLLVSVWAREEEKAAAWSIDCNVVRRMHYLEIVGCGELVQHVAEQLIIPGMPTKTVVLSVVQVLAAAKKRVQFVGGESFVHVLRNDGSAGGTNFSFSPHIEDLYEFFMVHGRQLLLATGTEDLTDAQFDEVANKFILNLKWKHRRIFPQSEIQVSFSNIKE